MIALVIAILGEHLHREEHILHDRHTIEERRSLEEHPHLSTETEECRLVHGDQITPIIEHLACIWCDKPDHTLDEDRLPCPTSSDDQIGLALFEGGINTLEHLLVSKSLG